MQIKLYERGHAHAVICSRSMASFLVFDTLWVLVHAIFFIRSYKILMQQHKKWGRGVKVGKGRKWEGGAMIGGGECQPKKLYDRYDTRNIVLLSIILV